MNKLKTAFYFGADAVYIGGPLLQLRAEKSAFTEENIDSAVKLARDMNIKVCDCYRQWKELSRTEDVTMLLANRINHPVKEMHKLFADSIFEAVMK